MRIRTLSVTSLSTATLFTGLLLLVLAVVSCSSTPNTIPEDLEPIEYFQQAQKLAMEDNDYQNAIRYYRTFIQRHPDDIQHVVEARYEIAFLYYKQGEYTRSKEEFEKLLSYYEGGGQNVLPEWPQILAKKILTEVEKELSGEKAGDSSPDSASDSTDSSSDETDEPSGGSS